MTLRKHLSTSLLAAACFFAAGEARADEDGESEVVAGWIVLGTGIAGGAALTTYGLSFDCDYDAYSTCSKRASIAIWSGIGIAATAATIGLVLVEAGNVRIRATADRVTLTGRF